VTAAGAFASQLGAVLTRYVALKRALGRGYVVEQRVFAHLDRFLAAADADLTAATFGAWSATFAHRVPQVRRAWMRIVRACCLYRQRTEPGCFVPDPQTFPRPQPPRRPDLVTEADLTRLLHATAALRPTATSPLQREGLRLALVLLYTAGLRRGELTRLTLGDYAPAARTLAIRATKFHKSRLVPLSRDAVRDLETYLVARRRWPHAAVDPLLGTRRGRTLRPYTGAGLAQGLQRLFRAADVHAPTGARPRVHDLRHSFAHAALRRWYLAGVDVQARLPALAVYLGHVSIASTQTYLAAFEPVAAAASARFAAHCAPFLPPPAGSAP
jgi:integrase